MEYPARDHENFPEQWKDPLELYGNLIHDLISSGHNLGLERDNIKELVDKYGARWVWDNRTRLVSMVKSLKDSAREVC
jgi:hypothetical protein